MTDKEELYESTRRLLKDLKYFTIHVLIYLPANILLILYAVELLPDRWWVFMPVLFWAVALIYHGVQINTNKKVRKLKALMSI